VEFCWSHAVQLGRAHHDRIPASLRNATAGMLATVMRTRQRMRPPTAGSAWTARRPLESILRGRAGAAQMLAFTQSPNLLLASKALPLWPALLEAGERSKGKAPEGAPRPPVAQLPTECVVALLDLAGACGAGGACTLRWSAPSMCMGSSVALSGGCGADWLMHLLVDAVAMSVQLIAEK